MRSTEHCWPFDRAVVHLTSHVASQPRVVLLWQQEILSRKPNECTQIQSHWTASTMCPDKQTSDAPLPHGRMRAINSSVVVIPVKQLA